MSDVVYMDASALVKLVVEEPESDALRSLLGHETTLVSCELARTEVVRAVQPLGRRFVSRARALLGQITTVTIDSLLLDTAADTRPQSLRSLDALHISAAAAVREDVAVLVTYDRRMADAATASGFTVESPGLA